MGSKGTHGAQKLQGPGGPGPHLLGFMRSFWAPWAGPHGPYQILKETYQILKETYPILKETYPILKETYQILKESYQIHGSMGPLSTFTRAPN